MRSTNILARDRMGKCRYVISQTGTTLRGVMRGYEMEGQETQDIGKEGLNEAAHLLKEKLRLLEQRMCAFNRISNQLKASGVVSVARTSSSVHRSSRKVNPLSKIEV